MDVTPRSVIPSEAVNLLSKLKNCKSGILRFAQNDMAEGEIVGAEFDPCKRSDEFWGETPVHAKAPSRS